MAENSKTAKEKHNPGLPGVDCFFLFVGLWGGRDKQFSSSSELSSCF